MSKAFDQALAEVAAAFRPERQHYQDIVLTACRIRELTLEHRYTFNQALAKLEVRTDDMLEAFEWLMLDNVAMNIDFDTAIHRLYRHEAETYAWLKRMGGGNV